MWFALVGFSAIPSQSFQLPTLAALHQKHTCSAMFARFLCAHLKGEARNSIKHGKGHLRKCTEAFTWPISFDGANSSVRSFVDLTLHPKELSLQQPSIAPCRNHKSCLIPDARFSAPNIRLSGAHAQEPRPYKDSTKPIHFV